MKTVKLPITLYVLTLLFIGLKAESQQISEIGHWGYGPCRVVEISNNIAFVGSGCMLLSIDWSDATNPVKLGEICLPDQVNSIQLSGNLAFVSDDEAGLIIIDISDPEDLTIVTSYSNGGSFFDTFIDFPYLYIADATFGLRILDISSIDNIFEKGNLQLDSPTKGIEKYGNIVYLASYDLEVVDVADPAAPIKINNLFEVNQTYSLGLKYPYLYVPDYENGRIFIYNITNPGYPELVNIIYNVGSGCDIAIQNDILYFSLGYMGLSIFDLSNPLSPQLMGHIDTGGIAYHVAAGWPFVLVADKQKGLRIFDVINPQLPVESGFFPTPNETYSTKVLNDHAYLANHYGGLRILDISDAQNPLETACYIPDGRLYSFDLAGNYCYVADHFYGLRIVDISDSYHPVEISQLILPSFCNTICFHNNYCYLTNAEGFYIADVTDPYHPTLLGYISSNEYLPGFHVTGDTLFNYGDGELDIYTIQNPAFIQKIGTYHSDNWFQGLAISKPYAFLCTADGVIEIIDFSTYFAQQINQINITQVGMAFIETNTNSISGTCESILYVSNFTEGFTVYNVTNVYNPQEIYHYNTHGCTSDIVINQDTLYVSDIENGLFILSKDIQTEISRSVLPKADDQIMIYPQPCSDYMQININLTEASRVLVDVYNSMGETTGILEAGVLQKGGNLLGMDISSWPDGIYIARFFVKPLNSIQTREFNVKVMKYEDGR